MATNKAASQKKATAKKPAAAAKTKTTVRTLSAKDAARPSRTVDTKKSVVTKPVVADPVVRERQESVLPNNIINIVLAELFGTFILTLVAMLTFKETGLLYVGLAFTAIGLAVGVVSGAHVNPAVTFGLWAMRRLKTVLVPFYWGAQFLGAMLAVVVINMLTNGGLKLDLSHFGTFNWSIFGIELIGTLVFLFILAAVRARELTNTGRAFGAGLALLIGLATATAVYSRVYTTDVAKYQSSASASGASATKEPEIPHSIYVGGPLLNPAVSVAVTEKTKGELMSGATTKDDKQYSRFSLELIVGTLLGAALGGNLYLLVAGRNKRD